MLDGFAINVCNGGRLNGLSIIAASGNFRVSARSG